MRGVNYRLDGLLGVLLAAEMLSSSGLVRKDCAQPAKRCVSKINSGAISAQPADLTHILCRREHGHSRNVLLLRAGGRRCGRSAVGFQAVGVAGASASLVALYISTLRNCRGRCPAYAGNTPKHMIIHEAKVVPKQLFYHIHSWLWVLASELLRCTFLWQLCQFNSGPRQATPKGGSVLVSRGVLTLSAPPVLGTSGPTIVFYIALAAEHSNSQGKGRRQQ